MPVVGDWSYTAKGYNGMEKRELPASAIRRNSAWIVAIEEALAEHGDPDLTRKMMKATGALCARQIFEDCAEILGRNPETIDELLSATNKRRLARHNLANLWERSGNRAHLSIGECGCELVKAGLATANPVHCLCSVGMFETLFSFLSKGPVSVEVVKTVGTGVDGCEFFVDFVE